MPTQQDVQRLIALREARKRGMMGPTQTAALQEIERRFSLSDEVARVVEPVMTMASSMVAEPVSGLVGLAALPFGTDVASNAINKTQQAMTYQPRTETGQQSLQGLQSLVQPVSRQVELAANVLGQQFGLDPRSPEGQAFREVVPAVAGAVAGHPAARAIPGRQLEIGDIEGQRFGQRGAIGGIRKPVEGLSPSGVFSELAEADDIGGADGARSRAIEIISQRPDLEAVVYEDYTNLGYSLSDITSNNRDAAQISEPYSNSIAQVGGDVGDSSVDVTPDVARSLFERDTIPEGWMVHGRYGRQDLDTGSVIQLSEDWGVAESYGKNGSMWMIKESSPETLLDLSGQNTADMAKVVEKAIKDYEAGALPWADDVRQAIGRDPTIDDIEYAVRSEFAPKNIVDSAQAFDNEGWVSWLSDSFQGKAIIKTPDGGVVLDPSKVKKVKVAD